MSDFRRRTVIAKKPYDAEIEYLELPNNNDTFAVVTNKVLPSSGVFKFEIDFEVFGDIYNNYCTLVSKYTTGGNGFILSINNKTPCCYLTSFQRQNVNVGIGKHKIELWSNGDDYWYLNIDENTPLRIQKGNRWMLGSNNITLFSRSDNYTERASYNIKYDNFKFYFDDILECDYIPVRVGQVGYMYDKVSHQLFGNSGTGNFILGPDL